MTQPQPYYPPPTPRPKSNTTLIILVVVIVVVIVGAVIATIIAIGTFTVLRTATMQHTANIVNGLITVPAGQYEYYQFAPPAGSTLISVSGSFTASGGSGNDIVVLVMDQTNFVNWQNGHTASAYYNSGQLTTGTITASLPSGGTYYLVYSNTFSGFSSKTVQTTADLSYYG